MSSPEQNQRAAFRYEVDSPVEGEIDGTPFTGQLKDVSATGAAIQGAEDIGYQNDQFVSLHMEGLGHRNGHIRRRIPDGFALEFEPSAEEQQRKLEAVAAIRAIGRRAMIG